MNERQRESGPGRVLAWLPSGLWMASALVAIQLARGQVGTQLAASCLHALIVGSLVAVLAQRAASQRDGNHRMRLALGGIGIALVLSYLLGWPSDAAGRPYGEGGPVPGVTIALLAVMALIAIALLFAAARGIAKARPRSVWVSGVRGTVLALLLGAPAVLAWGLRAAADVPSFVLHEVVHDFLAERAWDIRESNPDSPPRLGFLSPVAASEVDAGDKPSLLMTPPCRIELLVPETIGRVVLRAAAGVDKSVRNTMPEGIEELEFELEVLVDGESVFSKTLLAESARTSGWTPEEWIWHHVGGQDGLALSGGQRIELRTRLVDESALDALGELPEGYPKVGFGGVRLERERSVARTRSSPEAPNIVLVVMDTQRADRLGSAGYARPTTPHLDRLAERGTVFHNAHSTSSWTWPATASILTGFAPAQHGVLSQEQCTLQLLWETLPEALQAQGFTTHGVSCNPLIAPERYFDQGFETFVPPPPKAFRPSEEVMPGILDWLESHAGQRFFLYLHLVDPHTPHVPHPEELARLGFTRPDDFPEHGMDRYTADLLTAERPVDVDAIVPVAHQRWIDDQYDASVATGDRWLGVLFERLTQLGLDDRTVIAFTSDHGEELFDHAGLEHGHTLYQELVHVPLILAGPGIPRGKRVERVVSNRHLAPTLARLAGARLRQVVDAEDLLADKGSNLAQFQTSKGVWPAPPSTEEGAPSLERRQQLDGLRFGSEVLHLRQAQGREPDRSDAHLYDLSTDARQLEEIGERRPDRRRELYEELGRRLEHQRRLSRDFPVGTSEDILEMIEQIGYGDPGDEADEDP